MTPSLALHPELPGGLPEELSRRIHDALYQRTLNELEMAVLCLLVFSEPCHAGRERALSIAAIQNRLKRESGKSFTDRAIKDAVKELVERHEVPIGSCRGVSHPGYFLLATDDDRAAAARPVLRQALSELRRFRILSPKTSFGRALNGQAKLPAAIEALDVATIDSALAELEAQPA